jgi:hypothetical protein
MAEPVCCLCGKRPRPHPVEGKSRHSAGPSDWCQWQLEKGRPAVGCHETCVVALILKTVRERETGQRELFSDDLTPTTPSPKGDRECRR